jgi:pre-rRNA-processing protein TSR2
MFPSFVDLAAAAAAATDSSSPSLQNNNTTRPTQAAKTQSKNQLLEEPDADEIEVTLLQVMFDEFEANVDDQSEAEVADRIMKCRAQCAEGNFSLVEELRARWLDTKGKKVVAQAAVDPDQDTDWDSGSDDDDEDADGDVDMGDVPALVPATPKEKPQPQVDEDGFELVPSR